MEKNEAEGKKGEGGEDGGGHKEEATEKEKEKEEKRNETRRRRRRRRRKSHKRGTSADAIDTTDKVGVGDGGIARLDGPHRFTEGTDSRRRIEDNLSSVEAIGHPVQGVMTNTNGNEE